MTEVRILQAGLEEDAQGEITVRGVLDPDCLKYLNMGWYQREGGFSDVHINEIIAAYFSAAKIADITIGMRGQRVKSDKDIYSLLDKCFVIDGGQRVYAAAMALRERPDLKIHLGVKAYLGTTEETENEMFCKLGTTQVKIAPSILLRNKKKKSPAAALLLTISKDPDFALKDRITWGQRKTRHELVPGFTLARIAGALHAHQVAGLKSYRVYELLAALDDLVSKIGEDNVHTNVIKFFDVIDRCWSIRQLSGHRNEPKPQLRPLFMFCLAALFSRYGEFWDGTPRAEFYCSDKFVRKLKSFTLNKYVAQSVRRDVIYEILRKHLGLDPALEDIEAAA
jgi:hypothetical protein